MTVGLAGLEPAGPAVSIHEVRSDRRKTRVDN